jgi:ABC-type spermidine/putrescine transport system permease subunit I
LLLFSYFAPLTVSSIAKTAALIALLNEGLHAAQKLGVGSGPVAG